MPVMFKGYIVVLGLLLMSFFYFSHKEIVPPAPTHSALFHDTSLPIETRVNDLLAYMSLSEKIGQMALVEKNSIKDSDDIKNYGLGALLSGFGGKPENNTAVGTFVCP